MLEGTGSGGYATVGDFNRFVGGLTSHRLMRGETLQKLIDGGVKTADGMSDSLQHFLNSGVTVIILTNCDPAAAESIVMSAARELPIN